MCSQSLKRCLCVAALLSQQQNEDMKAVTQEVKDCKTKLDSFRLYVMVFVLYPQSGKGGLFYF